MKQKEINKKEERINECDLDSISGGINIITGEYAVVEAVCNSYKCNQECVKTCTAGFIRIHGDKSSGVACVVAEINTTACAKHRVFTDCYGNCMHNCPGKAIVFNKWEHCFPWY